MSIKPRKIFPELNYAELRKFADTWVRQFEYVSIKRIILHRVSTKAQEILRARWKERAALPYRRKHENGEQNQWRTTKYAVIFEFSGCEELSSKRLWDEVNSKMSLAASDRSKMLSFRDKREALVRGTAVKDDPCSVFFRVVKGAIGSKEPHPFLHSDFFKRVYERGTEEGFRSEWVFNLAHIEDSYIKGYLTGMETMVIFDSELQNMSRKSKIPEDVIRLAQEIYPEADDLANRIVSTLGWKPDPKEARNLALDLCKNRRKFRRLTEPTLKDREVYQTRERHFRDDFIGKLIQTKLQEYGHRRYSYEKLFRVSNRGNNNK